MRKAVLSVGVGALVALASVTAVGASQASGNRHLEITGVSTDAAEVRAGRGFVGTRFVGAEDLLRDGRKVGRGVRSCEVVAAEQTGNRAQFQCLATLGLPAGTLTLQAMPTLTEQGLEAVKAAVTGGTGAFRHARGEALMQEVSASETRYSIDLRYANRSPRPQL